MIMNNELAEELMDASGRNFSIVYQALVEAARDRIQSGPTNKVNKEKVLKIIARLRSEYNV